jgi:cytochrome c oxidase subunit III
MSSSAAVQTVGEHGDHDHPAHLAHHFDNAEQQYTAGKLGMWVFLGTELLMFGGLFCAYSIYRSNYPEVFAYAHQFLDRKWGAINTVVLIASSLTMAWGVRAAQLGQQFLLRALLIATILGGAGFMVIKTIEYTHKYHNHLFPGRVNKFNASYAGPKVPLDSFLFEHEGSEGGEGHGDGQAAGAGAEVKKEAAPAAVPAGGAAAAMPAPAEAATAVHAGSHAEGPVYFDPHSGQSDAAKIVPNFSHPVGLAAGMMPGEAAVESHSVAHAHLTHDNLTETDKKRVSTFFSIYFLMTGLHGVHVLVGMALITWVFFKSFGGTFGPDYYTPVDLVGLYWHLVDLIWIFLFPLLYLIH